MENLSMFSTKVTLEQLLSSDVCSYTAPRNEALLAKNHRLWAKSLELRQEKLTFFQEGLYYSQNHPGSKEGHLGIAEGLPPCARFLVHIR